MLGPLPLVATAPHSTAIISGLSLWKEQEECLQWLHGKDPGSVVYVNFGSIVVMTNEQLVEFAWGLANSGREFIWIIRRDLVKGDAAVLPPEFLAATAERGFMASWCPQQEVLNHPAVGAFLTHSGWNSALESICGGVPVLSWPFFADQQTNCRYQCNEWASAWRSTEMFSVTWSRPLSRNLWRERRARIWISSGKFEFRPNFAHFGQDR
jgi:hypothetical protein